MQRRRDIWNFFANPFVILADVMVSLVFIVSLFLLSTTVYSEQMELIAQRDARRQEMSAALSDELQRAGLVRDAKPRGTALKYQIGKALEVEDDGTIQRFRFLSGLLDFSPNSTQLQNERRSEEILRVFGRVLLRNRAHIKSVVIEGHADSSENSPWALSQARAETIRLLWTKLHIIDNVTENWNAPVFQFLAAHKLWDAHRFHEWHLQEYQARRVKTAKGLGVLPAAWVIVSGRGDQLRRGAVVEFKVEYTERDAPPLDDYLRELSPDLQKQARKAGLS